MFIPDPVALAGLIWLQMLKLGPRIGEGQSWEPGSQREGSDRELEGSTDPFQTEGKGTRMAET